MIISEILYDDTSFQIWINWKLKILQLLIQRRIQNLRRRGKSRTSLPSFRIPFSILRGYNIWRAVPPPPEYASDPPSHSLGLNYRGTPEKGSGDVVSAVINSLYCASNRWDDISRTFFVNSPIYREKKKYFGLPDPLLLTTHLAEMGGRGWGVV